MRKDKAIKFMQVARFYADVFSKDPSTKVGAILVNKNDFTQLTQGYNGMPRGVAETPERQERPLKYSFYEHAERNALYNLARSRLLGSIAVTSSLPGLSCIRALISVGVSEVVVPLLAEPPASWSICLALLKETDVTVRYTSVEVLKRAGEHDTPELARHLRKLTQYVDQTDSIRKTFCKEADGNATVFLSPGDFTQLAQGYSGMPRGADDAKLDRYQGSARSFWVEDSVRNAIYNLLRPALTGSVALVTATTCAECARGLAAVGVAQVFYIEPDDEFKKRWGNSIGQALETLGELGVQTFSLSPEVLQPALVFNA